MLNNGQLGQFRAALGSRMEALREEIRQELLDMDEEHFIDLAGQVYDLEEGSVADLLVDLDLAILDMHVQEARDIEAAQIRIDKGEYGDCIDCEGEIELERLQVYPTAKRCQPCQSNFERNHYGHRRASL